MLTHCWHGGHDDDGSGHPLQDDCVDPWPVASAETSGWAAAEAARAAEMKELWERAYGPIAR